MPTDRTDHSDEKLTRAIGRWDLVAITINAIIGAGIFGLPSKVYAQIGTYSLFAFVACALIVGLIVLCHAEVASRFRETGGPYLYAREAFGPAAAFEVGWLYWIVRLTTFAANCNLLVTYLGFFWPGATGTTGRIAVIAAVVAGLLAVNYIGVKHSARITNVMTLGKLAPLLIFGLVGIAFIDPGRFTMDAVPAYTSFSTAVLLLIYAFVGFEVALIPAGEVREPQKNYPFALAVALAGVAALYILVQIVSIGTLPELATSERPLADAASRFLGPVGAALIAAGALVSILGNLNVGYLGSSRIIYAMGERRELPGAMAATHKRFKTPYVSLLLNAAIILGLTIWASFITAVAIATITRLMVYATTCIALPIFRRRDTTGNEAAFKAPLGILAAVLSVGLIVWLLTNVDFSREGLPILVAAGVGLVIYGAFRLGRARGARDVS